MGEGFESSGLRLYAHLARPTPGREAPGRPGLVVCHGFPSSAASAAAGVETYPALADRVAAEAGWTVLTFSFRGVAALSARADFADWAAQPRRFLQHARDVGVVRDAGFPDDLEAWALELKSVRPLTTVASLAPRPLLLVQGADDDVVPAVHARPLADAHGAADLRLLPGAGHALRHEPRAVALPLGWLEPQAGGAPSPPG